MLPVEIVLFDLAPQIRSRVDELRILDDAGIHVDDIERPVWSVADVHRAEQRIGRADELRPGIRITKLREAVGYHDFRAPDHATDRLGKEEVAHEIWRQ